LRSIRIVAAVVHATLLASCTGVQRTVGGWVGFKKPAPETTEGSTRTARVYYAAVDGLKVYSEPSASSKVVGRLALHEKVTRSRLEKGYAYVKSSTSGVKGWVRNARLIWQLPTPAARGAAEARPEAPEATEPEAPEPIAPAEEPPTTTTTTTAPAPRAPRRSTTTLPGIPPSIFNPY
jgi:hypothetical protein